jgi:hypothetical protein
MVNVKDNNVRVVLDLYILSGENGEVHRTRVATPAETTDGISSTIPAFQSHFRRRSISGDDRVSCRSDVELRRHSTLRAPSAANRMHLDKFKGIAFRPPPARGIAVIFITPTIGQQLVKAVEIISSASSRLHSCRPKQISVCNIPLSCPYVEPLIDRSAFAEPCQVRYQFGPRRVRRI